METHKSLSARRRVPTLSDKLVAFLLQRQTRSTTSDHELEREGDYGAIVSPDLQRATNTQPDRERNCSENAPSCVIIVLLQLRNGLPRAECH